MKEKQKAVRKVEGIIRRQKEVIEYRIQELAQRIRQQQEGLEQAERSLRELVDRFQENAEGRKIRNIEEVGQWFTLAAGRLKEKELRRQELEQTHREILKQHQRWHALHKKTKALERFGEKLAFEENHVQALREQKILDALTLTRRSGK